VAASDFTAHLDALERLKQRYEDAPWLAKIEGQYSGELLRGEIARAKSERPEVPWRYPAMSVLRRLRIPQIWVLAQDDSVAPSANTVQRLQQLQRAGASIRIFVFPHTDHGIRMFRTEASGERVSLGYAPGYLQLLADGAKGVLAPAYGDAHVEGSLLDEEISRGP
jgi:uncharacterized protein